MVHALEEIHHLLRPTGALIDIHPVAEPSPVEIHQAGTIALAGSLSVRQWCVDFEQADGALAEVRQRGLFTVEQESVFDSFTYYDTAAEMGTSFKESIDKFARDGQSAEAAVPHIKALAARAEQLIRTAGSGAELRVRERTHISRLRPVSGVV